MDNLYTENDVVIISKKEYESLKRDSDMLMRLHDAGVDNWSGYYYAFQDDQD